MFKLLHLPAVESHITTLLTTLQIFTHGACKMYKHCADRLVALYGAIRHRNHQLLAKIYFSLRGIPFTTSNKIVLNSFYTHPIRPEINRLRAMALFCRSCKYESDTCRLSRVILFQRNRREREREIQE